MQRIFAIAILLTGASFLMAQAPAKPPMGPPPPPPMTGTLEGATPGSDGLLFQSMGWDKFREKSRVSIYYYMQSGISTNNTIKKGDPGYIDADDTFNYGNGAIGNNANGPVATPSDADEITFEQTEQFIERGIRGNMVIGVTPTPAPMYKHFDWGFLSDTVYGRQVNGCRMTGFDRDWAMNPNPQNDTFDRYNWLCEPNAYFDLYFPVLKGVALRIGRQADQLMTDEIPPNAFFSPNNFYSHTYGFYRIEQVLGGRIIATIMHSHKNGFLMGEFNVNASNQQSAHSLNGAYNYGYALRYRTPHMDTWVDYTGRLGPAEVKINCSTVEVDDEEELSCTSPVKSLWISDQLPQNHVFSTTHQMFFENALQIKHEFRPKWTVEAFFQFGKQFGNGADGSDGTNVTISTYTPAGPDVCGAPSFISVDQYSATVSLPACKTGFTGASYVSEEGRVTYEFNKKLNATFRIEQFHNPNAFFGEPMFAALNYPWYAGLSGQDCYNSGGSGDYCYEGPPIWGAAKGSFNDISWGANYNPNVHFRIRPEIRYDWQSGNYGVPLFGQNNLLIWTNPSDTHYTSNTESSQLTAAIDTVFYF